MKSPPPGPKPTIPQETVEILLMLLFSRVALVVVGVISKVMLGPIPPNLWQPLSSHLWLDIWGVWDSGWYVGIATNGYWTETATSGYTAGQASYAFFPLYPMLMRAVGFVIGDFFVAGILVSNAFLVVSCIYFRRLMMLEGDPALATRSVKYLILFPTAFVLSGVLSESLYLALSILCFYHARRGKFLFAGICGALLALTRFIGVFVVLPLAWEYFRHRGKKLSAVRADALFLLLVPLGTLAWAGYNYHLTGDFLAFAHNQSAWGGGTLFNPLERLLAGMSSPSVTMLFKTYSTAVSLVLLVAFCRRIGFSYFLLGMVSILFPLASNAPALTRYLVVVFPLFVIFARVGARPAWDRSLTLFLAILQGFLMTFWKSGLYLVT